MSAIYLRAAARWLRPARGSGGDRDGDVSAMMMAEMPGDADEAVDAVSGGKFSPLPIRTIRL
jgi:hypothetical protein